MKNPFARDSEVDQPGIIGARWWNKSVVESAATQGRRVALAVLAASVAGVVGLCTLGIVGASSVSDDDEKEETRQSLKLQQDFGWNFDVPNQTVVYTDLAARDFVRSALSTLVEDLAPAGADLLPFYVPTLFQSPEALPKVQLPDGSNASIRPIAEALRPIRTSSMIESEGRGKALAKLVASASPAVALVVDLDGPDAVAFASGAASLLDPVFLFDNWPHPNGVVKAHLALAAAVYHQPDLRAAKGAHPGKSPPMFVLDRTRLATYTDSPTQFDNRYTAKLPPASALRALGVSRVLYVAPLGAATVHLADLEASFAQYRDAQIDVRAVMAEAFAKTGAGEDYHFGGMVERDGAFLSQYGWDATAVGSDTTNPPFNDRGKRWTPPTAPTPDPSLATIGVTTVAVALATGYVLRRSGTWNRAPSGSWGGG